MPHNPIQHQPYDPYYGQNQIPGEYGGISTLFVGGLPDNVKAREIHNLFSRRPGFDYSQLKYTGRGNQVVAFVTFHDHHSALAALHQLNDTNFDPEGGSKLHIELARSNSRRKHKPGGGYVVIDERHKTEADAQATWSDDGGSESDEPTGQKDPDSENTGDVASENSNEPGPDPGKVVERKTENTADGDSSSSCSTLFIANLGPNCTEDELKQVFSQYPGFNVLRLRNRSGMPIAFADFEEVDIATKVLNDLQGTLLTSSDRGGMHLEYARSKMRKP